MTERTRALIDEKLQQARTAIERGSDPVGVVAILVPILPLCVDRRCAHAYVERAFEEFHLVNPDCDFEIDPSTVPFVRPDVA